MPRLPVPDEDSGCGVDVSDGDYEAVSDGDFSAAFAMPKDDGSNPLPMGKSMSTMTALPQPKA